MLVSVRHPSSDIRDPAKQAAHPAPKPGVTRLRSVAGGVSSLSPSFGPANERIRNPAFVIPLNTMKSSRNITGGLAAFVAGFGLVVRADEFTVTRTNISGPGSLQAILAQVNATPGSHIVRFGITGKFALESSLPKITTDVVIEGREGVEIRANGAASIFRFANGVTARLSDLTIANGYSADGGGAVWNEGILVIERCTIADNRGGIRGGAVHNAKTGSLTVRQCSFAGNNVSPGFGGGIWNSGVLAVEGSTFAGNRSEGGAGQDGYASAFAFGSGAGGGAGLGGALFVESGTADLTNCTLSGNSVSGGDGGAAQFSVYVAQQPLGGGPFPSTSTSAGFGTGGKGKSSTGFDSPQGGGFGGGRGGAASSQGQGGSGMGGALFAMAGTSRLVNCTVVSNSCTFGVGKQNPAVIADRGTALGGGLYRYGGSISLLNTIVQGNTAAASPDLAGEFVSAGYNIIGNNAGATGLSAFDYQNETALLGPLGDNGGPTRTHAPLVGSVAIDGGTGVGAPARDQRGNTRPAGSATDIGAVEAGGGAAVVDSDSDGLTDIDERDKYGTNPNVADTDGDSFADGFEVANGSDPKLATSVPELVRMQMAVELEIFTNAGHRYQLESSTDLQSWADWGASFDGVGGRTSRLVSILGTARTYWRLKRL